MNDTKVPKSENILFEEIEKILNDTNRKLISSVIHNSLSSPEESLENTKDFRAGYNAGKKAERNRIELILTEMERLVQADIEEYGYCSDINTLHSQASIIKSIIKKIGEL